VTVRILGIDPGSQRTGVGIIDVDAAGRITHVHHQPIVLLVAENFPQRLKVLLDELDAQLDTVGINGSTLAFNLTWHDWLNLKNLVMVSKSIRFAAMAREDSRGAHFRADHPDVRDLENSRYTCVGWQDGRFNIETRPVKFTRVKPGESLLTAG